MGTPTLIFHSLSSFLANDLSTPRLWYTVCGVNGKTYVNKLWGMDADGVLHQLQVDWNHENIQPAQLPNNARRVDAAEIL